MREIIKRKLADAVALVPPRMTRREARVPAISGKAHAVIGMRRAGKTWFLYQCLQDHLEAGAPRDGLIYFNFEDERLADMKAPQLSWVLEEYYARYPEFRDRQKVTFFFDEIQRISGWEMFIRRIMDSERVQIFVSGSSARMLSREVATALRGRGTETVIFPFGFLEFIRHHGGESPADPTFLNKNQLSRLERSFRDYLKRGGFPEAQPLSEQDRLELLQGYVDSAILRDVVERHKVSNVEALRRLVRQALSAATGRFSVAKFHADLHSQGVAVGKDTLHEMLAYLEDAFLLRILSRATHSERQRQANPRKIYPVDPALISAFDRSGKANVGQALETAVLIELERRRCDVGYVVTPSGFEVDFLATDSGSKQWLIQVAADLSDKVTREREFRALADALPAYPRAKGLLLTLTSTDMLAAQAEAPSKVTVLPAWQWMLGSRIRP